jgi:hypothetical protein
VSYRAAWGPSRRLVPLVFRDALLGGAASKTEGVTVLEVDLDVLTPAERRDLANALLRAAWSATLAETRILLLDLLLEVDGAIAWGAP